MILPPNLRSLAVLALAFAGGIAVAQPRLPEPESTLPQTLGLMQGFPPAVDKTVNLGNLLRYPNARWGHQHLRELGPTAAIRRAGSAQPLRAEPAAAFEHLRFEDPGGVSTSWDEWQRGTYTDALLVLHRGRIVYERYHAGMTPSQPHTLWSLSKSITGLLATQLIHEGAFSASDVVGRHLPELAGSAWGDATIQQVLDMTTGVSWREDFSVPGSEIFSYLYASGLQPSPPDYAGPRTLATLLPTIAKSGEHGTAFGYKTADTEVLGWLLQRVTGRPFAQLVSERLWQPLGAEEDAYVWVDGAGMAATSVGIAATLRDLGRLGDMLRMNGRVGGRQVVAEAAVVQLRRGGDREKFKAAAGQAARAGYSYHHHWWIAHDADGSFEAKGLNGQHLHINPAAEMVIVKLSSHPVPNTAFTHALDRRAFAAAAAALRKP